MAAHDGVVGDDDMIAQRAIMRDMRHRHQHAVGAHHGDALAGRGAAMNGAVLADLGARADHAAGWLALVFQVLRRQANRAERIQHHAGADAGVPVHHDMGDEIGPIPDDRVRTNRAERADLHANAKLRAGGNRRARMDADAGGNLARSGIGNIDDCIHSVSSFVVSD